MISTLETAQTPEQIREQLHEGYANLAFDLGNAACRELFDNFKAVAEQVKPNEESDIVRALSFDHYNYGNSKYELDLRIPGTRNKEDEAVVVRDHKYVFHFGPRSREHALAELGTLPSDLKTLLDNCDEFYQAGVKAAKVGAAALGIKDILFNIDPSKDIHHLRLIDYISSDNSTHAEPHFDRGTVTLAINESHPGLRGKPADNGFLTPLTESDRKELLDMKPIDHQENVAKFFASAGLRRLPEDLRRENGLDQVPLLAHDVVNEKPGINRQAVVMFFNPHSGDVNYHPIQDPNPTPEQPARIPESSRRSSVFYFVPRHAETKIETIAS